MRWKQLVQELDRCAANGGKRVERDWSHGLAPSEETLTENFLSRLVGVARSRSLPLSAFQVTKAEESQTHGADVALWFRDDDGSVAGVYLQAKRLFRDGSYRKINHTSGGSRQIDVLRAGAQRDGVAAGYMFHNDLDAQARSLCPRATAGAWRLGISVAPADLVLPVVRWKVHRQELEQAVVPLSCIIACGLSSPPFELGAASAFLNGPTFRSTGARRLHGSEVPDYLAAFMTRAEAYGRDGYVDLDEGTEAIRKYVVLVG